MEQLIRIGLDTSKSVFQVHGVDAAEQPVVRRKLRRGQVLDFFARRIAGRGNCGRLAMRWFCCRRRM